MKNIPIDTVKKYVNKEYTEELFNSFNEKFGRVRINSLESFTPVFYNFVIEYFNIENEEYSPILTILDVRIKGKEKHYQFLFQLEKFDSDWKKIEEINFAPTTQIIYK